MPFLRSTALYRISAGLLVLAQVLCAAPTQTAAAGIIDPSRPTEQSSTQSIQLDADDVAHFEDAVPVVNATLRQQLNKVKHLQDEGQSEEAIVRQFVTASSFLATSNGFLEGLPGFRLVLRRLARIVGLAIAARQDAQYGQGPFRTPQVPQHTQIYSSGTQSLSNEELVKSLDDNDLINIIRLARTVISQIVYYNSPHVLPLEEKLIDLDSSISSLIHYYLPSATIGMGVIIGLITVSLSDQLNIPVITASTLVASISAAAAVIKLPKKYVTLKHNREVSQAIRNQEAMALSLLDSFLAEVQTYLKGDAQDLIQALRENNIDNIRSALCELQLTPQSARQVRVDIKPTAEAPEVAEVEAPEEPRNTNTRERNL